MKNKRLALKRALIVGSLGVVLLILGLPKEAAAGYFELAGGFSYNKSDYGGGDFEWTRRWSASLGYHFSDRTELEASFEDVINRTSISGYQDTTFDDQTLSLSWVQSLFGREALFDPFFKVGLGQLDHKATGTYDVLGGASANGEQDSLTEILGVGVRIKITKRFALRAEGDTYLTDWTFSTWKNNCYLMGGVSFYF